MSVPTPPVSMDNSCSVIYDNTLYSFSQDGFLSLSLEEGAKWKKLDMGEPVSGAVCVGSTPADASDAGFFVVGGTTSSDSYPGLQKYTYANANWTTITPTNQVTKDLQWHGSTYIAADDVLVVYAGNQNGQKTASQLTFSIQASPPYTTSGQPLTSVPAAISPMLMPWSDADAMFVGGDASNQEVWLFNPLAGWRNYGATMATPMTKDTSMEQAVLMQGDDGSRSLLTFDMSQSPNQVSRFVLENASGQPVQNSAAVTSRDLTLQDWPEYNSTLAPTTTRTNFAMAQGSNGMIVFSGGNTEHPLSLFNASKNEWLNTTAFFVGTKESTLEIISSSSAVSSTSTAFSSTSTSFSSMITTTPTAAATTSAASSPVAQKDGFSSNTILGITLGSILGFMALLGLILCLMKRRKRIRNHAEAGHQRRASGIPTVEKEPKGFAKNTFRPTSPGHFRGGHHPQLSQESYSSMAILMGRVNQQNKGLSRQPSHESSKSSVSSLHKNFKSTISKPIPQTTEHPALRGQEERGVAFEPSAAQPRPRNNNAYQAGQDGMRRSSGWNRYWSGGSALQILGFGPSKRNTVGSEQSSRYSQSTAVHNPRVTQDSATVPPLNFEGKPEVNSVNSGSPVVSQSMGHAPLRQGMTGKIERPPSNGSSGYSSGIPESVNETWDPSDAQKPWGSDRAPSSAYSSTYHSGAQLPPGTRAPPSGVSKQPQLAMAAKSSDMSWLNLGDQSRV